MLRILIAFTRDSDASHENWYTLEFNEETGEWAIEHRWDYYRIGRSHEDGTDRYSLSEAKVKFPQVYDKAIELLKVRLFDKPITWNESKRWLSDIKYE